LRDYNFCFRGETFFTPDEIKREERLDSNSLALNRLEHYIYFLSVGNDTCRTTGYWIAGKLENWKAGKLENWLDRTIRDRTIKR